MESPARLQRGEMRQRRVPRIRIACLRCQRRKIRVRTKLNDLQCDGQAPLCGSCSKAGAECVYEDKQQTSGSTRAYISSLHNRVDWLEDIVRTRCPDVNLNEGPQVHEANGAPTEDRGSHSGQERQFSSPAPMIVAPATSQEVSMSEEVDLTQQDLQPNRDSSTALQHEIGLVSLSAGTDSKYIGPSSGYSFARLLLACATSQGKRVQSAKTLAVNNKHFVHLLPKGSLSINPTPLPPDVEYTLRLSEAYFETVHLQYPFLHRPSHQSLIRRVYEQSDPSPIDSFQVNMVLAISSTVVSRRLKVTLPGSGYCANAMKYFDQIHLENSLRGLQSLLLLLVYTLNSSSLGLNLWYLNYQCIAALLDLGLQRDVKVGGAISVLEQELRTRTFWVIYTLDRDVATMMGRPIGLRDEACELRLPADVDDDNLSATGMRPRKHGDMPHHMSCSSHLFKLAQLNSEIKYVCHSISHKAPPHSYPQLPDVRIWQDDIKSRLLTWANEIPQFEGDHLYMTKLCEIKYHSVMMLLLSPSPAIPQQTTLAARTCYDSAVAVIRLVGLLYAQDWLVYSWVTVHSVFLSTVVMLCHIWTVPEIEAQVQFEELSAVLRMGSNVLSAMGEHWPEAKRSRDVLDSLSATTMKWILERRSRATASSRHARGGRQQSLNGSVPQEVIPNQSQDPNVSFSDNVFPDGDQFAPLWNSSLFDTMIGESNMLQQIDLNDPSTVNVIMQGIFGSQSDFGFSFDDDFSLSFPPPDL